jgi:hypothetical protein
LFGGLLTYNAEVNTHQRRLLWNGLEGMNKNANDRWQVTLNVCAVKGGVGQVCGKKGILGYYPSD